MAPLRQEVEEFLARWAWTTRSRDAERAADLFLREPAPLVVFSDGKRAIDWLDVRVRLGRDLARTHIDAVDVHDIEAFEIAPDTIVASFTYDMDTRDMWGTHGHTTRHASMTLLRTKDGLRIAAAHFSHPPS